jgi:hypothetical protein
MRSIATKLAESHKGLAEKGAVNGRDKVWPALAALLPQHFADLFGPGQPTVIYSRHERARRELVYLEKHDHVRGGVLAVLVGVVRSAKAWWTTTSSRRLRR